MSVVTSGGKSTEIHIGIGIGVLSTVIGQAFQSWAKWSTNTPRPVAFSVTSSQLPLSSNTAAQVGSLHTVATLSTAVVGVKSGRIGRSEKPSRSGS